jgi:deazaflavin-dependent oxidoreductase (nitroreductase family)
LGLEGEYEAGSRPTTAQHVRDYEASNGMAPGPNPDQPAVILTTRGRRSGKLRKVALVRVEHEGRYAVVASMGGQPTHHDRYFNLVADPHVTLQDDATVMDLRARTATPEERAAWWPRATEVWPDYDTYQARTDRQIPVVLFDSV